MCIRTNQKNLKIAEKDITVYKLIEVDPAKRDFFQSREKLLIENPQKYIFMTHYLYRIIPQDCFENNSPFKAKGLAKHEENYSETQDYKYRYTSGLIHSFKYKKDSLNVLKDFSYINLYTILYKCTIPKGTEYIEGVEDNNFTSYAAKQIIFNEPVHFGKIAKKWYNKLHQTT